MTVSTTTNRTELVGNGTVGPYTLTFPILDNGDLKVYVGGTLKTLTTHYTVANAGSGSNATVTFTSSAYPSPGTSLSSSISLVFVRNVSNTQPSNYQNNDIFDAETLEQSLDRATMQIQQSGENIDRSIRFGDTATGIDASVTEIIAAANLRANKLISFDSAGDIQVTQEIGTYKGNWATATVYVQRDLVKQSSSNDGSTKDNVYICVDAHTSTGTHLTQNDSAKWALILDVATASGGVSESSDWARKVDGIVVATSGGNDYSSKAYAIGGSGVDDGSGSAKDWASKASGNVGNTSTKSAKQYADDASTSASTATSQAGIATTKASEASTSEGNALTYRNEAQTAKTAAETALDSFDDRYLGSKTVSSHPALDNDSNSLLTGALYYNTGSGSISAGLYVYSGSAWESMEVSIGGNTVTSTSGNNLNLVTPSNSNKVVINSGDKTIQLPNVRATSNNHVLAMSDISTGETAWQVTATAPTISGVTGELNVYESSSSTEDGGVLTLTGTDFGTQSDVDSIKIMDSSEANKVTASSFTVHSQTSITVTFNGSETGYNSWGTGGLASTNWHIQVTKSGLASNVFNSGKSFTKDPTIASVTQTASGDNNGNLTFNGTGGVWGSYGGRVVGGGQDSSTKLLMNFERTGGTDIEDSSNTGGDGNKVTASGHASIKASPFGDGKSAIFFDGTNDKLSIPDSDDWHFGTGSFTIEMWLNIVDMSHVNYLFYTGNSSSDNTEATVQANGQVTFSSYDGSYNISANSPTGIVKANTWHHLAFVRNSSGTATFKIFLDGVSQDVTIGNGTAGGDLHNMAVPLIIGECGYDTGNRNFDGYLDEYRIVKGSAVYTSNFTVPTSRLTAITKTKLLIHSNVNALNTHRFTRTNLTESTDGLVFNGSDSKLSTDITSGNTSSYDLDWTNDVTIEMWLRIGTGQTNNAIWKTGTVTTSTSKGLTLATNNTSGALKVVGSNGSSAWNVASDIPAGNIAVNNTWTYILFRKYEESGTHKFQTKISTTTAGGDVAVTTTSGTFGATATTDFGNNLAFGYWTLAGSYTDMDVKHIRVSKVDRTLSGQDRYSSTDANANLTIPAYDANVASDANTVLLYNQPGIVDSSDGASDQSTAHDITPTGSVHSHDHGGIAPAMAFPASGKLTGSAGMFFDGNGDYLSIGSGHLPSTVTQGSIDCWVYPFSLNTAGSTADDLGSTVMGKDNVASHWYIKNDGAVGFHYYNNSSASHVAYETASGVVSTNSWTHLAIVFDTNYAGIFVNGYLRKKDTTFKKFTFNSASDGADCFIGINYSSRTNNFFHGYIDSFRIVEGANDWGSGYSSWSESSTTQRFTPPSKIYGAPGPDNPSIGSIEIVTATDDDVNVTYSFQGSTENNASVLGSSSDLAIASDTTGANKKKGTLTGTLQGTAGSVTNLRIQAKANNDSKRLVEVNETSGVGAIRLDKADTGKPVLFNARRYVGNGTEGKEITGFGFGSPDLVWIKSRNVGRHHNLFDSVKGVDATNANKLIPNENVASNTNGYGNIRAFTSDGFTLENGDQSSMAHVNTDNEKYIAWAWKAGGVPSANLKKIVDGTESSLTSATGLNQSGDYSSFQNMKQSVNTAGGFSITTYTGASSSTKGFFKHGFSSRPDFVIIKNLTDTEPWLVWHKNLNSTEGTAGAGDWIRLNENSQKNYNGSTAQPTWNPWNTTDADVNGETNGVTSTQIRPYQDSAWVAGANKNYVCYAWKAVSGVSAFGTYDGNGTVEASGGNVINIGFLPKLFITKRTNGSAHWMIYDTFRSGASASGDSLWPYLAANNTEVEISSNDDVDLHESGSTKGVKLLGDSNYTNQTGGTYIYMAFA